MTKEEILAILGAKEANGATRVKSVDFRFTDLRGREGHLSVPAQAIDETFLVRGKSLDFSPIAGWQGSGMARMALVPDPETAVFDPFFDEKTLFFRCDIVDPVSLQSHVRDPRSIARRAEQYLIATGIADRALFAPEHEFFIFDDVRWGDDRQGCFYQVDAREAHWNSAKVYEDGNMGHRSWPGGGYLSMPPNDALHDLRAAMCATLEEMGLSVESHHHEVASAGQCKVGISPARLLNKADAVMTLKYAVANVAHAYGKTVTFMPKPIVGENGSGMPVHQMLEADGRNLFAGDGYAGLSDLGLYYIGGILRHAHALNAFCNASTNSYKRLLPGVEIPTLLSYSNAKRAAAVGISGVSNAEERSVEVRFPDATANPYLAFSALLMAGLDGIRQRIHPGEALDRDFYDLASEYHQEPATVCLSLEQALVSLDQDRDFLKMGEVFNDDVIDAYIDLKMEDVTRLRMTTHPIEFDLYYSL